jgi:hypothetical protein
VPLGSEVVTEIVERTDGVPLFVEELTKAVLEDAGHDNRVAAVLSVSPLPALAVARSNFPSDTRVRARQKPSPQPTRRGQPRRVQTTDRREDRCTSLAFLALPRQLSPRSA